MTSRPHCSGGVGQRPKFRRQAYFAHCWVPMPHDVPGTQQGLRSTAHPRVSLSPGSANVPKGGGDLPLQGPSSDSAPTFMKPQAF